MIYKHDFKQKEILLIYKNNRIQMIILENIFEKEGSLYICKGHLGLTVSGPAGHHYFQTNL